MRLLKAIVLSACLILAACAGNRQTTGSPDDYVEIDNPAATLSPDAPARIWVPRSYVERGVPRGGEILKKGAEQVVQSFRGSSQQAKPGVPEQQAASADVQPNATIPANQQTAGAPAYTAPPSTNRQTMATAPSQPYDGRMQASLGVASSVRNRIAILETGRAGLVQPLYEYLRRAAIGGILDPGQAAFLLQNATLTSESEKTALAGRLQQDYAVNVMIFLSAPDGAAPGKDFSAEVYDAMGGGLLQKFDATFPQKMGSDQADTNSVSLPATFTEKIRELLSLLPWYGRITAVEGNRAYIAAGRETGLRTGQVLKIFRSGRFIKGLGYAPGEQVGTLIVQGFVGPNGSFGVIREGQGITASDLVSVE